MAQNHLQKKHKNVVSKVSFFLSKVVYILNPGVQGVRISPMGSVREHGCVGVFLCVCACGYVCLCGPLCMSAELDTEELTRKLSLNVTVLSSRANQ